MHHILQRSTRNADQQRFFVRSWLGGHTKKTDRNLNQKIAILNPVDRTRSIQMPSPVFAYLIFKQLKIITDGQKCAEKFMAHTRHRRQETNGAMKLSVDRKIRYCFFLCNICNLTWLCLWKRWLCLRATNQFLLVEKSAHLPPRSTRLQPEYGFAYWALYATLYQIVGNAWEKNCHLIRF